MGDNYTGAPNVNFPKISVKGSMKVGKKKVNKAEKTATILNKTMEEGEHFN